ncbi:MAG: hypothetical protein WBD23_10635, partial [Candidatus Acidiferrales bacterium]
MNSSVIFRGAVGIALLLGVVWKIMMIPRDYDLPRDSVVGFLQQNHFSVTVDSNFLIDTPLIEARNNSCRLHIARVEPDGSNWNAIEHFFTAKQQHFIVFHGRVYERQPIL